MIYLSISKKAKPGYNEEDEGDGIILYISNSDHKMVADPSVCERNLEFCLVYWGRCLYDPNPQT